jgi:hypothetical protein
LFPQFLRSMNVRLRLHLPTPPVPSRLSPLYTWPLFCLSPSPNGDLASQMEHPDKEIVDFLQHSESMFRLGGAVKSKQPWGGGAAGASEAEHWLFNRPAAHVGAAGPMCLVIQAGVRMDDNIERALLFLSCLLYTHSASFDFIINAKWESSGAFARPSTASSHYLTAGLLFDGSRVWSQASPKRGFPVRYQIGIKPLQVLLGTQYIAFPFAQTRGIPEGRFSAAVHELAEIFKSGMTVHTIVNSSPPGHFDLCYPNPADRHGMVDFAEGWIKRILAIILRTEISHANPTGPAIAIEDVMVDVDANVVAFLLPEQASRWLHLPLRRFLRDRGTRTEDWHPTIPPRLAYVEMAQM